MRGMFALAIGDWDQAELFPKVTAFEIKAAKTLLTRYRRMRGIVDQFEQKGVIHLSEKQAETYYKIKPLVDGIEKAVELILDPEIKQIIERRYIRGIRHKETVVYFSCFHPTTVDRKINKGIESVAETLKLWES